MKSKALARSVGKIPAIKTRTSLVGMTIHPAPREPSDRAKPIRKDRTIKSSAA